MLHKHAESHDHAGAGKATTLQTAPSRVPLKLKAARLAQADSTLSRQRF